VALAGVARADVRIAPDSLDGLSAEALAGVEIVPAERGGGIRCTGRGIRVPTAENLTARSGTVDVTCAVGPEWPARGEHTLFHAQEGAQSRVTLSARGGTLTALYQAGEGQTASVRDRRSRLWAPGSRHRLQMSWRADGDDIALMLSVDGELIGVAGAPVMTDWPTTCYVGAQRSTSPWGGVIHEAFLSTTAIEPPELQPGERTVRIHADRPVGTCYGFWRVANCNRPTRLVQPGFVGEIEAMQPFIRIVNCVYMLGGRYEGENDWFQGYGPDGQIRTDFTGLIAQLQAALDKGFTPRIVLDNVPFTMSDPPTLHAYGNTAPPVDESVWHQYVRAAVQAMVDAFGRETVGQWRFRVGTEPDLRPAHWSGTMEEYFSHYDHTVDALKSVLPEAVVGPGNILNPAAAAFGLRFRNPWGLHIIDHAGEGTNAVTGAVGTPLEVFSCSWYASVGGPLSAFDTAVDAMRSRLDKYPQFRQVPIEIGEFAVLRDENGRRLYAGETTEWSASFYAALADRVYARDVQYLYEWDHATMGVLHPRGQVIGMLERMVDGKRLAVEAEGDSAARCSAVACRKDGRLFVLLYNHRRWRRPSVPETVRLEVQDVRMKQGQTWRLSEWSIDRERTVWAYEFLADCRKAGLTPLPRAGRYEGSPLRYFGEPGVDVFQANIEKYRTLSELPQTRLEEALTVREGGVALQVEMPGHSVRLLELTPP